MCVLALGPVNSDTLHKSAPVLRPRQQWSAICFYLAIRILNRWSIITTIDATSLIEFDPELMSYV